MTPAELVAWALAASVLVQDPGGHPFVRGIPREGAEAIAAKAATDPLFAHDDGTKTVALAIVMVALESGNRLEVVGDCWDPVRRVYVPSVNGVCPPGTTPTAFGPFQSHRVKAPFATWRAAVDDYWPILRRSVTECPAAPIAIVASGSCTNKGGIRKSDERMGEAKRVYRAMQDRRTATAATTTEPTL